MPRHHEFSLTLWVLCTAMVLWCGVAMAASDDAQTGKSDVATKATDTRMVPKPDDIAPDFSLKDLWGNQVKLSQYRGKKNVVVSFVPAAWTPVCSQQWPGYNIAQEIFDKYDTIVLGISVDNTPTLTAWTNHIGGLWFPVLSDFWPHGAVAQQYGVLRKDGMTERALFVIDKQGVIRYVDVHDVGSLPRLEVLVKELAKLPK